ncbi:hypothetical protein LTR40_007188 [Exophiala xenobiotica]|nr:hypothetical protein LTR40_007188 [Exophiala xenobiotica]
MVKLVVGQSPGVTWNLHEERLTSVSQYAKAAMRWPFKEEQERTIRLPEEDPAIFSLFVAYIYGKTELDIPWDEAIRLYVLADRLQAIAFRRKLFCKREILSAARASSQFRSELHCMSMHLLRLG